MNRISLMLLVLAAGFAQPVQGILNGQLAQRGATAVWAAAISAGVSAATLSLAALLVFQIPVPSPRLIAAMPVLAVAGGLIGAFLLIALTMAAPRLGATVTYLLFIAAIAVSSVMLDQFGAFGLPQQDVTFPRMIGIAMIVGGVAIVRTL